MIFMKKALRYSVVLCAVSWLFALFMVFGLGIRNVSDNPMKYSLCASLYMLFPLVCSIVIQLIDKERLSSTGLLRFKIRGSWFVAWFLPIVIVLLAIFVNSLFPNVNVNKEISEMIPGTEGQELPSFFATSSAFIILTIFSGLLAGISVNALFAFGEEYGWRNYLVSALREKNFVTTSMFIGVVWGLWHFPLILMGHNYPQHSVAGVFMMVIFCILFSFVETYFVLKAKSVYPAAIFHGTVNAVAGLSLIMVKGGNDLLNGVTGLSGFIVLLSVIILIYLFDKYVFKDNIFSKTIGEVLEDGER